MISAGASKGIEEFAKKVRAASKDWSSKHYQIIIIRNYQIIIQ